jgi:long-chain acyl-CoA synthetase
MLTDLGCVSQSLYTVSLYDTLGPTATEYIANHASLPCIVTSLPHIPSLLELKPRLPHLKVIISLDPLDAGERPGYSKKDVLSAIAKSQGLELLSLEDVEKFGESLGSPKFNPPVPSDIVTINYTSGTTGNPKGVVLSHRAAVAAISAVPCLSDLRQGDVSISYLPLAHIYGRMLEQSAFLIGLSIGYFHGNPLELVEDLKLLRPMTFASVPRLYNRFGGAIRAASTEQPGFKGALSRHVVSTKLAKLQDPKSPSATNKHLVYDRIWAKKVSSAIGLDRTRVMTTGSAPLDPTLHQFLRIVFANSFVQGFGMTETYAMGLCQLPNDYSAGNCGPPAPTSECCLLSVPDMDYLVTDKPYPRGELLIRGPNLFDSYYLNDEETSKSLLPGGWFKTGDICAIDELGRFKIIDRRKNVLKLAQGEYISPERIENIYLSHLTYLGTAFVHGDSVEMSLVALFGVAPDLFAPFASKVLGKTINPNDMQAIVAACKDPKISKEVLKDLEKVARKNKFSGYEKVKAMKLYVDPFTIENELLTPTFVHLPEFY